MSSHINWTDNKVFGPSSTASRQPARTAYTPPSDKAVSRTASEPENQPDGMMPNSDTMNQYPDLSYRSDTLMSDAMPFRQGPPPSTEKGYIPNFLAANIGKMIKAEFVIGTSQYFDRVGRLIEVGINYFVLDDINFNQHVMCDLYSVRFVTLLKL